MPLDGPSDGVFTAVTSQIAVSSLELRALPLGSRKLADEQARELGYLGYSGHFDVRPRSSSGEASECSRIGLQKALFKPYTVKSMQAWYCGWPSQCQFSEMGPPEWCLSS